MVLAAAVTVSVCAGQAPRITSVQNEASRNGPLCPGARIIIFASTYEAAPIIGGTMVAQNHHGLHTSLGEYLGASVPLDLPAGPSTVVLQGAGGLSNAFRIDLADYCPAVYSLDGSGTGAGYFRRQPLSPFDPSVSSLFTGLFRVHTEYPGLVIQGGTNPAIPGEVLVLYATGLGATGAPVTAATGLTRYATLAQPVRVTIDGIAAEVLWAGNYYAGGLVGSIWEHADLYQVRFRVPAGLAGGTHTVALEIAGRMSNAVALASTGRAPVITGAVNAASYADEGWGAPGSIMTLYGENLDGTDDTSVFPATSTQGISVSFDGAKAPLMHVIPSQKQINLVTPTELAEVRRCWPDSEKCVMVQLTTPLGISPRYYLSTNAVQPGVFLLPDPSQPARRNVAALLANTAWRVMPRAQARALGMPEDCSGLAAGALCGQPAHPGDVIQLYATGMGRATPGGDAGGTPLASGTVAPPGGDPLYLTLTRPVVTIGGVEAEVLFSGIAPGFAGLYQVNVRIPAGTPAGDDVPVVVGQSYYSDSGTIAVEK